MTKTKAKTLKDSKKVAGKKDKVESKKGNKQGASQQDDCKLCMVAAVEAVFVPCGHMATCMKCGKMMLKKPCPICRKKVKKVIKTYKA